MLHRLYKTYFFRSVAALSSGAFIAQLIGLLIAPVVTRLYTPEEFGVLAMFLTCASIFVSIATGKFEFAVVLPEEDCRARKIVNLAVALSAYLCLALLFVCLCLWSAGTTLFQGFGYLELLLVPFFVWTTSGYDTLKAYAIRHKRFKMVSVSAVLKAGSNAFLIIVFGLLGMGAKGLVLAVMLSLLAGNMQLLTFFNSGKQPGEKYSLAVKNFKDVIFRFRRFPKYSAPASFLNAVSVQLPILFLSTFFSSSITGVFSMANRVLNLPVQVISGAVGEVYFRKAAEKKNDILELRRITWSLYKILLLVAVLPTGVIFFWGEEIFLWVFGSNWTSAGVFASYLIFWVLFSFIASPLSNVFFVQEKQNVSLIFQSVQLGSRVLLFSTALSFKFSSNDIVIGLGILGACLYFIYIVFLLTRLGLHWMQVLGYTFLVIFLGILPSYLLSR